MKILTLMEDTSCGGFAAEHGLCFYVETPSHRLLLDTGASPATWANAAALGVDLTLVDTVVLSHGHYDHTGGLMSFAAVNQTARIYLRDNAFGDFRHRERYIGADPAIRALPNLCLTGDETPIDEELFLFSGITGRRLWPDANRSLSVRTAGGEIPDDFSHEQCLVLRAQGETVLLSGCAHNGILNILDRYRELFGFWPDRVISGFHMVQKTGYTAAQEADIRATARELAALPCTYYTGHCTGATACGLLSEILGDRLHVLHSGDRIL